MADPRVELTRLWFAKAKSDLESSRILADNADPHLDTAIYHCQQAAEKAMKSLLVFFDVAFGKTHDLRVLVELTINQSFSASEILKKAEFLTPYSTRFRYPDEILEPNRDEFEQAYFAAEEIVKFVKKKLPNNIEK